MADKTNQSYSRILIIRFAALIALGILVQIGAVYLLNGIMNIFPSLSGVNADYTKTINALTTMEFRQIIQVVIISPVLEEAVFRFSFIGLGIKLWNDFTKVKNQDNKANDNKEVKRFWILNIVSSLLFGIYHMNPVQFVYATLLGLILGYIYFYLGKYIASLVVHMVINTAGLYLTPLLPDAINDKAKVLVGSLIMVICCLIPYILKKKTNIPTIVSNN